MNITFITHSSFLIELEHTALLFDYYEGALPAIPADKTLYVCASHHHGDHFSRAIFDLAATHPKIQYLLSDDIFPSNVPEELLEKTVFLHPRMSWESAQLQVSTLKSTDEGIAFLIQCEGKTIYHAGDLNWWRWEGEPDYWNQQMEANFKQFIEPLRGMHIDVAFIPLDPRQENDYALGMNYYLALTDTQTIFPMHCWDDYTIIDRWLNEHEAHPYKNRLISIQKPGETFQI